MFKGVQSFQAPAPHLTNVLLLLGLGSGCPKPLRVHSLLLLVTKHTTITLVKFRNKYNDFYRPLSYGYDKLTY